MCKSKEKVEMQPMWNYSLIWQELRQVNQFVYNLGVQL